MKRKQHDAAVEGDDLAILRTAGRLAGRADEVAAARAAPEPQFLQFGLVGEVHHHAAGRALADDVGMAALAARCGFGARPVLGPVIGGIAPAADDLGGADGGRDLGRGQRLDLLLLWLLLAPQPQFPRFSPPEPAQPANASAETTAATGGETCPIFPMACPPSHKSRGVGGCYAAPGYPTQTGYLPVSRLTGRQPAKGTRFRRRDGTV